MSSPRDLSTLLAIPKLSLNSSLMRYMLKTGGSTSGLLCQVIVTGALVVMSLGTLKTISAETKPAKRERMARENCILSED